MCGISDTRTPERPKLFSSSPMGSRVAYKRVKKEEMFFFCIRAHDYLSKIWQI